MHPKLKIILAELRSRFEARYGDRLYRMVLYGSQAREDAEPESDIDVLVVLNEPVNPMVEISRTGDILSDLSLDYDVLISCVFMDQVRFTTRNGPLLRNIRKEGISV